MGGLACDLAAEPCEGPDGVTWRTGRLRVAGGNLYMRCIGSGPLVIALHGWTLDGRIWTPQGPLGDGLHLVCPDRRGFGRSSAPPDLAAERGDIDAMADHFGAEQFALIGLSQGAAVALDYACAVPQRVSHLALIGAPLAGLVPEPGDRPEIDRAALAAMVRGGDFAGMMALWRRHPLTRLTHGDAALLDAILRDYDGRDQCVDQAALVFCAAAIAALPIPLLALAGDQDTVWRRRVADHLAHAAPHGRSERVAHAGHLANLDQPGAVNTLLRAFLCNETKG